MEMNLLMITLFAIILIVDSKVIGRDWGGGGALHGLILKGMTETS